MNLIQYIQENPNKTLTDVQQAKSTSPIVFNSNEMTMYLTRTELLDFILDATSGLLRGFALRLAGNSRFDFRENTDDGIANIAALSFIISQITDENLKTKFIALRTYLVADANKPAYPFESVTQSQYNIAKNKYISKTIELSAGNDIVLTLNADLAERVAATVWRIEEGFEPENAGRNIHIQNTNKYRIDMRSKKSGNYEVRVPLLDADFIVELV